MRAGRRPREVVALDVAVKGCREAAADCEDAARTVAGRDPELARLFRRLARAHLHVADELDEEIRRLHELPREPDPDRLAVHRLVRHLRFALAPEGARAVLRERVRGEDDLASRVAAAAATGSGLSAGARAKLARAAGVLEAGRQALARAERAREPALPGEAPVE